MESKFNDGDYVVRISNWLNLTSISKQDRKSNGGLFKIKSIDFEGVSDHYGIKHSEKYLRMATLEESVWCDLGIQNINDVILNETEIQ